MRLWDYTWTIGALVLFVGAGIGMRILGARMMAARAESKAVTASEQMVANLRLRLPPGAEFVVLEHQCFFNDERNRALAIGVFQKNNFETTQTETFENRTKYWMLAKRAAIIGRAPEEVNTVVGFVRSYGGTYDSCRAQT